MRHLQTHRRSRAFLRFCQVTSEPGKTMKSQTLTHIILPLAQAYLCTEKYAKINSLIDSAIDVSFLKFCLIFNVLASNGIKYLKNIINL
jgi:U3 small nucleolar RNA-associated protein 20